MGKKIGISIPSVRTGVMDKKTGMIIAAVSTAAVALVGGGLYSSPYLVLNNMKTATANRNADALSREIDFPSLRASVRENVRKQIIKQISTQSGTERLPEANLALVDQALNPIVDKIVTPEGISELMQDKIPEMARIDFSNLEKNIAASDIKMGYESLDRFVVHITDKVDRAKDVMLTLKRDGLAWRLSGIDISKV